MDIIDLPPTSSRCLTKSTRATHNFEVTSFSLLDGMGVGKSVDSSTFSVGGGNWNIKLYPDGNGGSAGQSGFVSIFLSLVGGGVAGVRCKLSLGLLDINNRVLKHKETKRKEESGRGKVWRRLLDFEPGTGNNSSWGWPAFIRKSTLKPLLSASKDTLTVRCVLTIIKGHVQQDAIVIPPPSLHHDLARILKDGEGTDVTFSVGGELLHAHTSVLAARSMVFKALLWGDTKEKAAPQQVIEIGDMEHAAVFQWLLYYIYTDSLPDVYDGDKIEAMQHLLVAADRYGLDRLKLICEERLCSWIDVESVAHTLALADQHQCVHLKDACLRFIAFREVLPAVMRTEGYNHLTKSCPVILNEILSKIASQDPR